MKKEIHLYTDGSSRGNPGLGGWAYVALVDGEVFEGSGAPAKGVLATNNQMELVAAIEGLRFAKEKYPDMDVLLFADSAYVLGGLKGWLDNWVRNGWRTSTKKPVENKELWETLYELRNFFGKKLQYKKVEGHAGDEYNERADVLAVEAALSGGL